MRQYLHKSLRFELPQDLPHNGAAYAGHFAQDAFLKPFTGLKSANRYGAADRFGNACSQGGGDARDPKCVVHSGGI
jgi:hypothetical protein